VLLDQRGLLEKLVIGAAVVLPVRQVPRALSASCREPLDGLALPAQSDHRALAVSQVCGEVIPATRGRQDLGADGVLVV